MQAGYSLIPRPSCVCMKKIAVLLFVACKLMLYSELRCAAAGKDIYQFSEQPCDQCNSEGVQGGHFHHCHSHPGTVYMG